MANANETAAAKQQMNGLLAALGQTLSNLSVEEIGRLHDKKEELVREFSGLITKLAQPEPAQPPAHETIRIPCTIGGRNYLACGFLKAGEPSVFGQTMLDRTRVEGTTGIDDGEWAHLLEHQKDFKKYQGLDPYYLVTERRSPDFPRVLSYLGRDGRERYESSGSVGGRWGGIGLVLRRCP